MIEGNGDGGGHVSGVDQLSEHPPSDQRHGVNHCTGARTGHWEESE